MKLHGTQRPLGARVVREGFWEEATLIQNRLCYGWGIHVAQPCGAPFALCSMSDNTAALI